MINIAICDECKECKEQIMEVFNKIFFVNNIECRYYLFENGKELVEKCKERDFNVVVLDTMLKDGEGIKFAKELKIIDQNLEIIFISESQRYIFDALDVDVFNYLLKPLDLKRLINVTEKLADKFGLLKNSSKYYVIKKSTSTRFINTRDIKYISVKSRIITLHCENEDVSFYGKIEEVLHEINELSSFDFIRAHRSYLINPFFVKKLDKLGIELEGDVKIPVSRLKFKEIEEEIHKYYGLLS
ncbi:MAG: LytR/AlgR family response regulator transcription factor [Sarcina sp.]